MGLLFVDFSILNIHMSLDLLCLRRSFQHRNEIQNFMPLPKGVSDCCGEQMWLMRQFTLCGLAPKKCWRKNATKFLGGLEDFIIESTTPLPNFFHHVSLSD